MSSQELGQSCLKITEDMMKTPCGRILSEIAKCKIKDIPKTNPPQFKQLSFDVIVSNLKSNSYHTHTEWLNDIKMYFQTQIDRNKNDPIRGLIFVEYQRKTMKKASELDYLHPIGWTKKIFLLRQKIDDLLRTAPDSYSPHIPMLQINRKQSQALSLQQIDYLSKAISKMTTPSDLMRILKILESDPSGVDTNTPNLRIEMKNLSNNTLQDLFIYISSRIPYEETNVPNTSTPQTN